jgi:hypothetical protein
MESWVVLNFLSVALVTVQKYMWTLHYYITNTNSVIWEKNRNVSQIFVSVWTFIHEFYVLLILIKINRITDTTLNKFMIWSSSKKFLPVKQCDLLAWANCITVLWMLRCSLYWKDFVGKRCSVCYLNSTFCFEYLCMICYGTVLISAYILLMIGWPINDKLEEIWKETAVA